jgi:hypothetical protein
MGLNEISGMEATSSFACPICKRIVKVSYFIPPRTSGKCTDTPILCRCGSIFYIRAYWKDNRSYARIYISDEQPNGYPPEYLVLKVAK